MPTLENDLLAITIQSLGAELTKVYAKKTKLDYIWNGNPSFWKRHSPILFPIVGKLKNDSYRVEDTYYKLPQHGFARDTDFTVVQSEKSKMVFELLYSKESLAIYPYKFRLQISYEIIHSKLIVNYQVRNEDAKDIYYSIGAHPALNCPLTKETNFKDYYIEFTEEENPMQIKLNPTTGFRTNTKFTKQLGRVLPLSYALFENDAIIFENIKSKRVSLKSSKHAHGVHMHIPNWDYLAFWTKKVDTPFICFEPWMGITDSENSDQNFVDKKAIQKLAVGKTQCYTYTFEFF